MEKKIKHVEILEVPGKFYMTVGTASTYVDLSPNTLRKYANLGLIKHKRLPSGRRLFCKDWLDQFVNELPEDQDDLYQNYIPGHGI